MSDFLSRLWFSSISNDAKLLCIYLVTGPHANTLGAPRVPPWYAINDLSLSEAAYIQARNDLCAAHFVDYCERTHYFLLRGPLTPAANPNVGTGRVMAWQQIPDDAGIKRGLAELLLFIDRTKLRQEWIDLLEVAISASPETESITDGLKQKNNGSSGVSGKIETVTEPFVNRCETVTKPFVNRCETVTEPLKSHAQLVEKTANNCFRFSRARIFIKPQWFKNGFKRSLIIDKTRKNNREWNNHEEKRPNHYSGFREEPQMQYKKDSTTDSVIVNKENKKNKKNIHHKNKTKKPGALIWEAYADAYQARYGIEPVRNAKTNGQCAHLVTRLGAQEAPCVARWYVAQGGWYAKRNHPLDLLIKDAETLRMRWATDRAVDPRGVQSQDEVADILGANGVKLGQMSPENEQALAAVFAEEMDRELSEQESGQEPGEHALWLLG